MAFVCSGGGASASVELAAGATLHRACPPLSLCLHASPPTLICRDANQAGKATVLAFDGSSSWNVVGLAGFSLGTVNIGRRSLAFQPNTSLPFLGYEDSSGGTYNMYATMMKLDGTNW